MERMKIKLEKDYMKGGWMSLKEGEDWKPWLDRVDEILKREGVKKFKEQSEVVYGKGKSKDNF